MPQQPIPSHQSSWQVVAVAFGLAAVVASLGASVTDVGVWYRSLRKPSFQPPDGLFGPVWTTLYGLIALAAAKVWISRPQHRKLIGSVFAINALLNVLWSVLFFHFRRPDLAFVDLIALWVSIVALIVASATTLWTSAAALLLLPYLAWVTFAGVLNFAIIRLNY